MTKFFLNILTCSAVAVLGLTLLTGCFRKHIENSTPHGATPATRVEPTPALRTETKPAPPAEVKKTPGVIEETYVIEAPKEAAAPKETVKEADLDAETATAKTPESTDTAKQTATTDTAKKAAKDTATDTTPTKDTTPAKDAPQAVKAKTPEAPAKDAAVVMGEMFYIQVGTFSELENANKVLSSLIEEGYSGSKLIMNDNGQFRVQAGAFTDKEAAREALSKLMETFDGAFIIKGTPQ